MFAINALDMFKQAMNRFLIQLELLNRSRSIIDNNSLPAPAQYTSIHSIRCLLPFW